MTVGALCFIILIITSIGMIIRGLYLLFFDKCYEHTGWINETCRTLGLGAIFICVCLVLIVSYVMPLLEQLLNYKIV